jgi:hypothetical protein
MQYVEVGGRHKGERPFAQLALSAGVKLHQASGMSPDPDIESVDWDWRTPSGCRLRYIRP